MKSSTDNDAGMESRTPCTDSGGETLSRFLDNDLPSHEAADVALHLQACPVCQAAYEQTQRARTLLRGLPPPDAPFGGPDAARIRVFERVRRSVRVGDSSTPVPPRTARLPFWAGTAAATAAVCLVGIGVFSWNAAAPSGDTAEPTVERVTAFVPTAATAPAGVTLPSQNEMSLLYHLHDAHSASLSASDPTDRRDCAAEARAALLRDSERLADTGAF